MRYVVADLPVQGTGAFTPALTQTPLASSWGLVQLAGSPGVVPQKTLAPTNTWAPPISQTPATQPSNVAPNEWRYDVYTPFANNMGPASTQGAGFGMAMRRMTPLPVPAMSWRAIPLRAFRSRKIAGRAQVPQPHAFQRFPNWNLRNLQRNF